LVGQPGTALLDSGGVVDGLGRYSFLVSRPHTTLEVFGDRCMVRDAAGAVLEQTQRSPFQVLSELATRYDHGGQENGPLPYAVGLLGYELGRGKPADAEVPDLWFGFYRAVLRFDHSRGESRILGELDATRELALALEAAPPTLPSPRLGALDEARGAAAIYREGFAKIQRYLEAGDIYQVNLARKLVAPIEQRGDLLQIYRAIRQASGAPFGAFIELGDCTVVSSSPEQLISRAGSEGRVETRPIKGTRRRTGVAADDERRRAELGQDAKELAEHLMIVDLERNELCYIS
jgi:para-aminobenzoate synthetase component 1